MQSIHVALALLRQGSQYYFQLRNGDNQSGARGFIGCFGGKIETHESARQAVCRELAEETNVVSEPDNLRHLSNVQVRSDQHNVPVTVDAHMFLVEVPTAVAIVANEGSLVHFSKKEISNNLEHMTPATRACMMQMIKRGKYNE